jgi:hypothetical protein
MSHKYSLRFLTSMTMFLSAGLLFAVQPMLGKMMLPLVGGSPSGWLTALAFFQLALLAGYLVAHGLSRLSARGQALATVAVLAAGAVLLPPGFHAGGGENISSTGQVLWLLFKTIFVPYLGLATVSSGLQRLYAARTEGEEPYFLYAASNAGSFVGLLAYPLVVEPFLPLSVQVVVWTAGYGLLMGLIALLAWPQLTAQAKAVFEQVSSKEVITWRQRLLWVALAFVPSSLSMGLTSLVTADLGSFPLLWVIPLGLYLLTFVIAFGSKQFVSLDRLNLLRLFSVAALFMLYMRGTEFVIRDWYLVFIPVATFFLTALWCHTRLANLRPSPKALTEYFLWMSVGGALGGSFNAFIAPQIFTYSVEFLAILLLSLLLSPPVAGNIFLSRNRNVFAVFAGMLVVVYNSLHVVFGDDHHLSVIVYVLLAIGFWSIFRSPRQLACLGIFVGLIVSPMLSGMGQVAVARNFFGTYRVLDTPSSDNKTYRLLYHGAMVEGMQTIAPVAVTVPHIYFWPLHDLFAAYQYHDVAMVGFGTGTALCFNDGTRDYTVYEINPLVVDMARQYFGYLAACGEPHWQIGDARLKLEQNKTARYDLMFMDAFASASIPPQLITREAMALYISRMKPDGMIVWNVNSLYYDLALPLSALAHDAGWQIWKRYDEIGDRKNDIMPSHFVLMARADRDLSALRALGWEELPKSDFPVWRDDFTNILAALRVIHHAKAQ